MISSTENVSLEPDEKISRGTFGLPSIQNPLSELSSSISVCSDGFESASEHFVQLMLLHHKQWRKKVKVQARISSSHEAFRTSTSGLVHLLSCLQGQSCLDVFQEQQPFVARTFQTASLDQDNGY